MIPCRADEPIDGKGAEPVTKQQLRKFLEKMGWPQTRTAEALDIDHRTMRRYVSGDKPVPKAVELALKYLAEHPEEGPKVKDLAEKGGA